MIQWRHLRCSSRREFLARLLVGALGSICATGCEQTFAKPQTSADIDTKELGISIRARSNGIHTQVFVAPLDKHGVVALGPTDQLLIGTPGQVDKPFVNSSAGTIAQIPGDALSFSVVLVRKVKRFTTHVEMPPQFSVQAHYEQAEQSGNMSILTKWTPHAPDSTMILTFVGSGGFYETPQNVEQVGGSFSLSENDLKVREYHRSWRTVPIDTVVTATRSGGKVTLDPAFASIPHEGKLEQIRTTVVGPPPPPTVPSAEVAADPAH